MLTPFIDKVTFLLHRPEIVLYFYQPAKGLLVVTDHTKPKISTI